MTPLLETKGLTKVYARRGGSREAVHQVSFRLAPGEALAVVGGSGCGKSTAARFLRAQGYPAERAADHPPARRGAAPGTAAGADGVPDAGGLL